MIFPNGFGIFETIKTVDGYPVFLEEHLSRATVSAAKMKISIAEKSKLREDVFQFLFDTEMPSQYGRLRLCFFEDGSSEFDHSEYLPWTQPARLNLSKWIVDSHAPFASVKSLPYQKNLDAISEARAIGFDEVVRLNQENHICEAATANLLLKIQGRWVTPPVSSGCLPGIIRAYLLARLPISEEETPKEEMQEIESMFLLSSLREIQPVSHLAQRELVIGNSFYQSAAQELAGVR